MVQISGSGASVPAETLEVLDSYIDVDFARLFNASVSISDEEDDVKKADGKSEISSESGSGMDIQGAVNGAIIDNDEEEVDPLTKPTIIDNYEGEIDPLTKITSSLIWTPELSQHNSRCNSLSTGYFPKPKVIDTPQATVTSGSRQREQVSDGTTTPDMDIIRKEKSHDNSQSKPGPVTPPPSLPIPIRIPTTRLELRALYDKFPDIDPAVPARAPTFFNRGFNQQSYLNYARSPPTTPRRYGTPDSRRLAESFASRTPLPATRDMPPRMLKKSLRDWYQMPAFMAKCRRDRELDPYPHLDMNDGWNRARCQGEQWHDSFSRPWKKPNKKMLDYIQTQEQFARFSWSEQSDSIVVDGGLAKGAFDRVFQGVDAERERMEGRGQKRTPGAWWGQKKRLFGDSRGRGFKEEIHVKNCQIWDGVKAWAANESSPEHSELKRKFDAFEESDAAVEGSRKMQIKEPARKRTKARRRIAQVMSDKWRNKRRTQEKKAGRWTDGTPLQNRMWVEFHWVLDARDHRDQRFFDTRDWPTIFAERGWQGITKTMMWIEFSHGWGPLQSWLVKCNRAIATQRQHSIYVQTGVQQRQLQQREIHQRLLQHREIQQREMQQRRQRQWAADAKKHPNPRYEFAGSQR